MHTAIMCVRACHACVTMWHPTLTNHPPRRAVEGVLGLLRTGVSNRRVGETAMNEKSSRSHSVFTAVLEGRATDGEGATHIRYSRLHLVDLAGAWVGGGRGGACGQVKYQRCAHIERAHVCVGFKRKWCSLCEGCGVQGGGAA